jgi:hypothetical protein
MVIVAVGNHYPLNVIDRNAEIPVFPVRLRPAALKSAAVDEVIFAVNLDYVLGTGNFLSRAEGIKTNTHIFPIKTIPKIRFWNRRPGINNPRTLRNESILWMNKACVNCGNFPFDPEFGRISGAPRRKPGFAGLRFAPAPSLRSGAASHPSNPLRGLRNAAMAARFVRLKYWDVYDQKARKSYELTRIIEYGNF